MHHARSEAERNVGEELFFDGRDTPGNVNLLGQKATTQQGSIARLHEVTLTGQAATATKGDITGAETFEFTIDSMTGTNGTAITSHTGELGAVWTLMMASGTLATIQSNRLRGPQDDTGSTLVYASGAPSSADYYVEALMYMNQNQGCNFDQLDVAVGARCQATGGGEGYFFGWNVYWSQWELHGYSGGGYSILATDATTDVTRTQGETKTLRITVTGTGATVRIVCKVDGVTIFDYNDTSGTRVTSANRAGLLITSDLNNFDINAVTASTALPVEVALTGKRATATQYPILFTGNFAYDTFSDTSWLEYHTGETGTWPVALRGGTNQWAEDGSVTYPDSTGTYYRTYNDCLTHNPAHGDYVVEADFIGMTGGGWYSDTLQTGIVTRMASDGATGYGFGYGYYGGVKWMLVKFNSQYGGHEILGSATLSSTTATVKLVATGSGDTVTVKAYVDGTEVISYSDTASDRVTAPGKPGLASYCYTDPYISVDNFKAYYDLTGGPLILTGQVATASHGTITPVTEFIVTPLGRSATTGYGTIVPEVSVVPLGQQAQSGYGAVGYIVGGDITVGIDGFRANTAQGEVTQTEHYRALTGYQATTGRGDIGLGDVYVVLEGRVATATQGTLIGELPFGGMAIAATGGALSTQITAGFVAAGAITPEIVQTARTTNPNLFPGTMNMAFVSVNGVLNGFGEFIDTDDIRVGVRRGLMQIDQRTRETYPWTNDGTWFAYEDDPGTLTVNYSPPTGTQFPRGNLYPNSGYPSYTAYTPKYNVLSTPPTYGFLSVDRDGNIQTLTSRGYVNATSYDIAWTTKFFAWEDGGPDVDSYDGPETIFGTFGAAYDAQQTSLSYTYRRDEPIGLYAVQPNVGLAFYPVPYDSAITGARAALAGHKAIAKKGTITQSSDYSEGAELTGLRITARAWDSYDNTYPYGTGELWGNYFPDAKDAHAYLTGLGATAKSGPNAEWANVNRVYPTSSTFNVLVGYKRVRGEAWDGVQSGDWTGDYIASSFTGADNSFVLPNSICVTHSGYGDVVYVTYTSTTQHTNYTPTHIGVLVMDCVTDTIYSNTLYAVGAAGSFNLYSPQDEDRNRQVAEVYTLSNGTSLTQFIQSRTIVKLSWTYGTRTSPTVTIKDGPSSGSPVRTWESLEQRGDDVHHVFWTSTGDAIYNDATSSNSTWTTATSSVTGDTIPSINGSEDHDYFSGFGSGHHTLLLDSIYQRSIFGGISGARVGVRWANYWGKQAPVLTVSAKGMVGRVSIITSLNASVALTGQAATTDYGTLTPDTTRYKQLTGLSITTRIGLMIDVEVPLTGLTATTAKGLLTVEGTGGEKFAGLVAAGTHRAFTTAGIVGHLNGNTVGQVAVAVAGEIGLSVDQFQPLTGLSLTTAINNEMRSDIVAPPLLGRSATMSAGICAPELWNTLVSVRLNALQGTMPVVRENILALIGQESSLTQGVLTGSNDRSVQLVGRSATCSKGDVQTAVTVDANTPPMGLSVTAAAGQLVPLVVITPTGERAVTEQGTLQLLLNIFLTGRQGVLVQGTPTYSYGSTAIVSGVYSKGEVGAVEPNFPRLREDAYLWARTEVEKLFVVEKPSGETADAAPLI
jgi:hypothetical protein